MEELNDKNKDPIKENDPDEKNKDKFWLEDITVLTNRWDILPNCEMTDNERLNATTRLILIIALILLIFRIAKWWLFLILGIVAVVILWYKVQKRN